LLGGLGADMLLCGSGNDTLDGGVGSDVLSGGRGGDTFAFTAPVIAANLDLIVDYSYVEGDKIDLSALLNANFDPGVDTVSDFVRLTQVGSNITVQVDADGTTGGANWADVAMLSNYGTTPVQDLVRVFFDTQEHILKI
jgi:Ca2+-binding RTX toxin-like protein